MRTVISLVAILMVVAVVMGCSKKDEKQALPTPPPMQGFAEVKLAMDPFPPVALKDTTFTATITDEGDTPINGANVVFDLSMPGMYHGENRPAAAEISPGVYQAKGIFTMGGKWHVRVEVKAPGTDVTREFNIEAVGG